MISSPNSNANNFASKKILCGQTERNVGDKFSLGAKTAWSMGNFIVLRVVAFRTARFLSLKICQNHQQRVWTLAACVVWSGHC